MTATHPTPTVDMSTDVVGYTVIQTTENNNPTDIVVAVVLGVDNYIEALRIQKDTADVAGNEATIREICRSPQVSRIPTEREQPPTVAGLY